jgi:TATA-binding protein-associated factor
MDLVPYLQTLRRQCQALVNSFVEHGKLNASKLPSLPVLVQGEPDAGSHTFSIALASAFVEKDFEGLCNQIASSYRMRATKLLKESRGSLLMSIEEYKRRVDVYARRITSAAAGAVLWLGDLGAKLNPIIQGIMNAVKVLPHLTPLIR